MDIGSLRVMVVSVDPDVISSITSELKSVRSSVVWSGAINDAIQSVLSGLKSDVVLMDLGNSGQSGSSAVKLWNKCKSRLKDGGVSRNSDDLPLDGTHTLQRDFFIRAFVLFFPMTGPQILAQYKIHKSNACTPGAVNLMNRSDSPLLPEKGLLDSDSSFIDDIRKKIADTEVQNDQLRRRIDTCIWKHLRPFKFPTIPPMKNIKEEEDRLGQYEMTQILGHGGFGFVRAAVNTENNQKVAIKQMCKDKLNDIEDVERVEAEIKLMINLSHPNIVRLLAVEHTPQFIYIIMEYLSGGDLQQYISENGSVREDEIRRIMTQLLNALEYCHTRRICHRDIKPENILFDEESNIRLTDFGLSCKNLPGQTLKNVCGSTGYIAPEILLGEAYDGLVADIFSVGCVMMDLIVGVCSFYSYLLQPSNNMHLTKNGSSSADYQQAISDFHKHSSISKYSPSVEDFLSKTLVFDKKQRSAVVKIHSFSFLSQANLLKHPFLVQRPVLTSPTPMRNVLLTSSLAASLKSNRSFISSTPKHASPAPKKIEFELGEKFPVLQIITPRHKDS